MNVPMITMNPDDAAVQLADYQTQLQRRIDPEYEAIAAGLQYLAEDTPLINLRDVFAMTGLSKDGRPKLAIARADRKQVKFWASGGFLNFITLAQTHRFQWGNYQGGLAVSVPFEYPAGVANPDGFALVPLVPAAHRPRGLLSDFFILWEVEAWANNRIRATPDRDPFLLRHVAGDLYAVLAEWDLTPLERAVMASRRQA